MWMALKILGYNTYHFKELGTKVNITERHMFCWREALTAKLYGSGEPYGKPEFTKLLGGYNAITDAPCVNFSDELVETYPSAKVILTNRDPEKWLHSIFQTYHRVLQSKVFRIAAVLDPGLSVLTEVLHLVLHDWSGGDWRSAAKLREGYSIHYRHVREIVPQENLLEWEPKDGWEPLCKFLGKPVPEEPFPYANKGNDVSDRLLLGGRIRLAKWVISKLFWPSTTMVVALLALRFWRR
ncbi:hypothetical protein BP6252_10303 [Coleophoma cylindrospora]|uniref:Uncharacterized protein n=1 Tax=Coleophoma cylindrospora TaxID=1849047 RepID=A0A3D8QS88_9HELO|nr:hypothetical protein BP6252_10303 [Coleophoma cylindrospora]